MPRFTRSVPGFPNTPKECRENPTNLSKQYMCSASPCATLASNGTRSKRTTRSKKGITLLAWREERVAGERWPAARSRRERELGGAPGKRTRPWEPGLWAVDCGGEREAPAAVQAAAMEEAMGGDGGAEAEEDQTARPRDGRQKTKGVAAFINPHFYFY